MPSCGMIPDRRKGAALMARPAADKGERPMTKLFTVVLAIASLVLVAPIIESGTSESTQLFVAVGNADGGGGE